MEYTVKEKREYSPYFDLHFVVKDGEVEKEFSFPLYDPSKPFTEEEEYMTAIRVEMEYEMSIATAPVPENTPVPLEGF